MHPTRRWWNCFAGTALPGPGLRGISGFGAHSVYHTQKLPGLSADLPLIVEVVDTRKNIDGIMPHIDEMMAGGMITLEKATVIRYTHKQGK
jgi:uncharacterized protein